jgi:hypothetical protein
VQVAINNLVGICLPKTSVSHRFIFLTKACKTLERVENSGNHISYGKSRMKSFAHFFLFGIVAASLPAVACMLLAGNVFGDSRKIAVTVAIICAQSGYFYIKFARGSRRGKSESLAAADAAAAPRTSIYWSIIGSIAGVVCSAVLFFTAFPHILGIPPGAGRFDRVGMESLVAQVRNQKFSGDRQFYWADVSGTVALSTGTAAGYPNLWAQRTEAQNLKVTIWTNGGGHASPAYGFAYSDVPLAPDGTSGNSLFFFTSGPDRAIPHPATSSSHVHLINRIDAHWWEVYYDSRDQPWPAAAK